MDRRLGPRRGEMTRGLGLAMEIVRPPMEILTPGPCRRFSPSSGVLRLIYFTIRTDMILLVDITGSLALQVMCVVY